MKTLKRKEPPKKKEKAAKVETKVEPVVAPVSTPVVDDQSDPYIAVNRTGLLKK